MSLVLPEAGLELPDDREDVSALEPRLEAARAHRPLELRELTHQSLPPGLFKPGQIPRGLP